MGLLSLPTWAGNNTVLHISSLSKKHREVNKLPLNSYITCWVGLFFFHLKNIKYQKGGEKSEKTPQVTHVDIPDAVVLLWDLFAIGVSSSFAIVASLLAAFIIFFSALWEFQNIKLI